MSDAHRRKKQPVLIRQQLLSVAARLASTRGVGSVTLDAVAAASAISKGGLLHHFPTKASLLEAMLDSLLDRLDAAIGTQMRSDPLPQGRFTRAYLRAVIALRTRPEESGDWAQVTLALLTEPALRQRWRDWVEKQSEDFVGTDSSIDTQIVRFATDGIWLSDLLGSHASAVASQPALIDRLISLTHK
ncbi:MAG: TetR/AcrR family transcriptional regulator [Rhizobium sp.]